MMEWLEWLNTTMTTNVILLTWFAYWCIDSKNN